MRNEYNNDTDGRSCSNWNWGRECDLAASHGVLPARFLHNCSWSAYCFKKLHLHKEQDCLKKRAFHAASHTNRKHSNVVPPSPLAFRQTLLAFWPSPVLLALSRETQFLKIYECVRRSGLPNYLEVRLLVNPDSLSGLKNPSRALGPCRISRCSTCGFSGFWLAIRLLFWSYSNTNPN